MEKFKLIKEYPGSPKLGEVILPIDNFGGFSNKSGTFVTSKKTVVQYPEFWEHSEKIEDVEIRFKTNRGNKIFRPISKIDLVNGYRFIFPGNTVWDIVIGEEETEFNFCNNE